jgi:hypothetical protein
VISNGSSAITPFGSTGIDADDPRLAPIREVKRPVPHFDSKLRGCDLAALSVGDVALNRYAVNWATVRQRKTVGLSASS